MRQIFSGAMDSTVKVLYLTPITGTMRHIFSGAMDSTVKVLYLTPITGAMRQIFSGAMDSTVKVLYLTPITGTMTVWSHVRRCLVTGSLFGSAVSFAINHWYIRVSASELSVDFVDSVWYSLARGRHRPRSRCGLCHCHQGLIARSPLKSPLSWVPLKTWVSTQPVFIARKYCVVKLSLLAWVSDLSDRPRNNR